MSRCGRVAALSRLSSRPACRQGARPRTSKRRPRRGLWRRRRLLLYFGGASVPGQGFLLLLPAILDFLSRLLWRYRPRDHLLLQQWELRSRVVIALSGREVWERIRPFDAFAQVLPEHAGGKVGVIPPASLGEMPVISTYCSYIGLLAKKAK